MVEWALVGRCERRLDKCVREQEQGRWFMRGRCNDGGCVSTVGNKYSGPTSRGTVFND
jgi:hypothetical protein